MRDHHQPDGGASARGIFLDPRRQWQPFAYFLDLFFCSVHEAIDHTPASATAGFVHVVRCARERVLLTVEVSLLPHGEPRMHRARDISSSGVRLDAASSFVSGMRVFVSVGEVIAVPATVIWAHDGQAGIRFDHPIDPERARSRAIVRSATKAPKLREGGAIPQAGWIAGLSDAYHRSR